MKTKSLVQQLALTAGIVGPILYAIESLVNGWLQPGYSFTADHISELAQFPHGWVQDITFVLFGILEVIFAVGFVTVLPKRNKLAIATVGLLLLFGAGAIGAGKFPEPTHGLGIHGVVSSVAFIAIIIAMLTAALYWKQQRMGVGFMHYSLASCTLAVLTFLVWTVIVEPHQGLAINDPARIHTPFGHWIGAAQRTNVAVWLLWLVVAAYTAIKIVRRTDEKKR